MPTMPDVQQLIDNLLPPMRGTAKSGREVADVFVQDHFMLAAHAMRIHVPPLTPVPGDDSVLEHGLGADPG